MSKQEEKIDVTIKGRKSQKGHLHPITQVKRRMMFIFQKMGFEVVTGPEVETEWYNFDALNILADHPARDMWDTFWLKPKDRGPASPPSHQGGPASPPSHQGGPASPSQGGLLLRTHTSPVQARYMEKNKPPFRIIVPGKIFRHEATDASHEFQLYHLEGLMIGRSISAAHFKGVVQEFFKRFFEKEVKIRLRPSFFPFVEPGFEIDIECVICEGKGCSVCSKTGWLEMMGAGMVHPKVLENVGIEPKEWQGFAFGLGIDRVAMMYYKIPEIRWLHSGDIRFLNQF